jgi:hypothetical protein
MSTNPNLLKNLTNAMVEVSGQAAVRVLSSGGGGGGGGASGIPVVDAAGINWLWFYDTTTDISTYISFATGNSGTPTFPVTPDSDTEVEVSNFPATQTVTGNVGVTNTVAVSGPLTDAELRASAVPVTGNIAVTNFPATQPVSAASLPLPTGAATETTLAALNTKIPAQAIAGLLPVDTLGTPGVARAQATSGTAANIVLTTTCRRVSMFATQGTWYSISGTATATSHYVGTGERIDFDVPASTTISVLQETVAGSIRITELV